MWDCEVKIVQRYNIVIITVNCDSLLNYMYYHFRRYTLNVHRLCYIIVMLAKCKVDAHTHTALQCTLQCTVQCSAHHTVVLKKYTALKINA